MLPLRLKMTNFLAYREETVLDFAGIRLACLTGHNGAGKSAILDALTFALWGKGRSRSGDLVHLGSEEALVELEFEHDGQRYKVARRVGRGKKDKHTCELFYINADGQPENRGGHVLETNKEIEKLLRMPYDTFIHSAYLQQGKADAFTVMGAAKRKELLADILGIQAWERYEENAKARRAILREELKMFEGRRKEIQDELLREPALREALAAAEAACAEVEREANALDAAKQALEGAEPAYREAEKRRSEAQRQLERLTADLASQAQQAEKRRAKIAEYRAILAEEPQISAGYQQFQAKQEQNDKLNQALMELRPLEAKRTDLERQIAAARAELEKQIANQQVLIAQYTEQAQAIHQPRLDEIAEQIKQLEALEQERAALQEAAQALNNAHGSLRSEQKRLEAEGKKRKDQIQRLETLTDPTCPTCGQALTDEHRAEVVREWTAEVEALRAAYAETNKQVRVIEDQIAQNKARDEAISRELANLPRLRGEQGQLQQAQKSAQAAQTRLTEAAAALDVLTQRLRAEDYALGERAKLREVQAQLEAIKYSSDDHQALQTALDELRHFEEAHRQLDFARQMLPNEEDTLRMIEERITALVGEQAAAQQQIDEVQQQLPQLAEEVRRYRELREQAHASHLRLVEAEQRVRDLRQELNAIEAKKKRLADYDREEATKRHELGLVEELISAFGKNGVPAMIIESAVPELEDLTNDLLRRMTNERMNVTIRTQRETKAGTTSETLDIQIADELGTRSYDVYSGGEAFRVNFALRVALAKLVARRAGAQVRTLFIDEGFGTQDEEGRLKLVEAITTVQHDFDLILVITHMEDLRDAFPVHITVEKTDRGSRLRLQ
jgi:exonuclease SbcC